MDRCEDVFTRREGDLSDSSSQLGRKPSTRNHRCTPTKTNLNCDSSNDLAPFAKINTIPVTAESTLIAEAKQMRLDKFHSDKICTLAASTSTSPTTSPSPSPPPSPSFPVTAEYAHMALGHPFKVSRCRTIQALKLSARVKRTRYNTAAMLDEALIHDAANFTVDNMAQRQQLLDLFGYVEPPEPSGTSRPNGPEALTGH